MVRREMFPRKTNKSINKVSNRKASGKAPKNAKKENSSKEARRDNSLKAIAKERKQSLRRVAKKESTLTNVNSKSEEILLIWRQSSALLTMTGHLRKENMTKTKEQLMKNKIVSMLLLKFYPRNRGPMPSMSSEVSMEWKGSLNRKDNHNKKANKVSKQKVKQDIRVGPSNYMSPTIKISLATRLKFTPREQRIRLSRQVR